MIKEGQNTVYICTAATAATCSFPMPLQSGRAHRPATAFIHKSAV